MVIVLFYDKYTNIVSNKDNCGHKSEAQQFRWINEHLQIKSDCTNDIHKRGLKRQEASGKSLVTIKQIEI